MSAKLICNRFRFFGDAAVADFAEPEDAFENAEGMLHIGANARLGAVDPDRRTATMTLGIVRLNQPA